MLMNPWAMSSDACGLWNVRLYPGKIKAHLLMSSIMTVLSIATWTDMELQSSNAVSFLKEKGSFHYLATNLKGCSPFNILDEVQTQLAKLKQAK